MKKNLFYVAAIALVFAGCSQNDDLQKPQQEVRKGTTFIGGSSLEIGESPVSRTSLDYDRTARTLKYMWEPGDKIWLNDGNNAESSATSSTENSSFVFTSGTYTNATYDVYYPGKNATAYNTVTIATTQAQGAANTTKHIGEAGDCGTATATRQANGNYKFSLAHKASYLCFLPRTTNASGTNWVLTGIKVKSDNNIAGNYTLSSTGLSGTGSSDEISLSVPNFDITNSATNQSLNASYMVIAPGTHSLTVEYTVKNAVSNQTTTITKTLAANKNYAANTVYPVTAMLFTDYSSMQYYQWDAQKDMWYGKTPIDFATGRYNPTDYPSPSDAIRAIHGTYTGNTYNYDYFYTYPDGTRIHNSSTASLFQAHSTAANNPSIQEILWIRDKGDAHWDDNVVWTFRGKVYKGGMWFKKLSVIASENGTTEAVMKTTFPNILKADFQMHAGDISEVALGTPTDTKKYFFLPPLGGYECPTAHSGQAASVAANLYDGNDLYQIKCLGIRGVYFTSTANSEGPLVFSFSKNDIRTGSYGTLFGYSSITSDVNVGAINMSSVTNF